MRVEYTNEELRRLLASATCQICGQVGANCGHLLIAFGSHRNVIAGVLAEDVENLQGSFVALGEAVVESSTVCGTGIVHKAMSRVYEQWGPGITVGELLATAFSRNYLDEYLRDVLDRAPNLEWQTIVATSENDLMGEDCIELVWGDMPEAVKKLLGNCTAELRALTRNIIAPRSATYSRQ